MISLDTDRTISGLQVLELFACPIGKDENGNYVEHEDLSGTVQHRRRMLGRVLEPRNRTHHVGCPNRNALGMASLS
jgi:hypothetical protein